MILSVHVDLDDFHWNMTFTCDLEWPLHFTIRFFSSPEPKAQVSYCQTSAPWPSVRGPSVNFHIFNFFFITAWWILMKLGRDEVLMVPYKSCFFLATSAQGRIQGGAKIGHGGPILQETSSDQKTTTTNQMHSNDLEACGMKCLYFWFHSEVKLLTRFFYVFIKVMEGGCVLMHVYVWEHIVSLYYRTAWWMHFTKLGRDDMLMALHMC